MSTAAAPADGSPVDPHFIGHTLEDFCEASCGGCTDTDNPRIGMMNNIAYPHPSALRSPLTDFDLRSPIYIGARYDLDATKHFQVRAKTIITVWSRFVFPCSRCAGWGHRASWRC